MKSLMDHTKKGGSVMTKADLVEKMAEDADFQNRAKVVYTLSEMKAGFQCSGFRGLRRSP